MLEDNAEKVVEDFSFTKTLSPEEMDEYRERFAETCIELTEAEESLKVYSDLRKAEMKPVKELIRDLQKAIKNRAIEVEETAYLFPDYDSGVMNYYNSDGELLMSRRLRPEERQTNIHTLNRKIS